jgi:hypothetical protein
VSGTAASQPCERKVRFRLRPRRLDDRHPEVVRHLPCSLEQRRLADPCLAADDESAAAFTGAGEALGDLAELSIAAWQAEIDAARTHRFAI